MSEVEGEYIVVVKEALLNVPEPAVLHKTPVAFCEKPVKLIEELSEQTKWSRPAFTIGSDLKVYVTVSVIDAQLMSPWAVRIKSILPLVVSIDVGK